MGKNEIPFQNLAFVIANFQSMKATYPVPILCLTFDALNVFYPFRIQALEEVSMIVKERQIVALLGRKAIG